MTTCSTILRGNARIWRSTPPTPRPAPPLPLSPPPPSRCHGRQARLRGPQRRDPAMGAALRPLEALNPHLLPNHLARRPRIQVLLRLFPLPFQQSLRPSPLLGRRGFAVAAEASCVPRFQGRVPGRHLGPGWGQPRCLRHLALVPHGRLRLLLPLPCHVATAVLDQRRPYPRRKGTIFPVVSLRNRVLFSFDEVV